MSVRTVNFDRIGRNHDVDPLVITDTDDYDKIAGRIYRYARPHLRSRDIEVIIDCDEDGGNIRGIITVGFNNGGTFTITETES